LNIGLRQATDPDQMGEWNCGVCRVPFVAEAAQVQIWTHYEYEPVCPSCTKYLGRRNPKVFPTIEEFEEATRRYREPIFASPEGVPDAVWSPAYQFDSWIDRDELKDCA
jgi:hypothetical protein